MFFQLVGDFLMFFVFFFQEGCQFLFPGKITQVSWRIFFSDFYLKDGVVLTTSQIQGATRMYQLYPALRGIVIW